LTPCVVATFWGFESFPNDLRKNAPPIAEVGLIFQQFVKPLHLARTIRPILA